MAGRGAWRLVWLVGLSALAGCQVLFGVDLPSEDEGSAGNGGAAGVRLAPEQGAGGIGNGGGAGSTQQGVGGSDQGAGGGGSGGAGGAAGGKAGAGGSPCDGQEGRLVINEVQTEGPNGGLDEFIEIYNAGPCPAHLDGLEVDYLGASGTSKIVFWTPQVPGRILEPNRFFVLGHSNYVGPRDETITSGQGMSKTAAGLALFFGGKRLDSLAWGDVFETHPYLEGIDTAPIASSTESLIRYPDGADTDINSFDFFVSVVPSPGLPNVPPGGRRGEPPARE
jgi:hypothetical protein